MESLTNAEERVMQILWQLKKAFVKDIIARMPDPKPPYNTISSVVRILEKKGFVDHKAYGKTHEYFPAISKVAYKRFAFKNLMKSYFDNSYESVVSFIANEKGLSNKELHELEQMIDESDTKE